MVPAKCRKTGPPGTQYLDQCPASLSWTIKAGQLQKNDFLPCNFPIP